MATSEKQAIHSKKNTLNVYFLAASEDEHQCEAVKKYLAPVIRNSKFPIHVKSDFDVPPGEDVKTYKQGLFDADIVIAFISADFINDDDTYHRTQKVMKRYNDGETVLLPVLVRNCMWKSTPFVNLPLLPKNSQPINNKQFWNSYDDAITSVVTDVYEAINNFTFEEKEEEQAIQSDSNNTILPPALPKSNIQKKPAAKLLPPTLPKSNIQKKPAIKLDINWRKTYYKRTYLKRGFAFILDQILILGPIILLFIFLLDNSTPEDKSTLDEYYDFMEGTFGDPLSGLIIFATFIFPYLIICAIFESSGMRATPGKRILKLEITDKKGDRIKFFKSLWRNILKYAVISCLIAGTVIFYIDFEKTGIDRELAHLAAEPFTLLFILPLVIQIVTFFIYKKLLHDQISFTVIGERVKHEKAGTV